MLKAGQIAVLCTDWTRASLALSLTLHTPWTHVCMALGDGTVLNTYPATNADIVPETSIIGGRSYRVLDLPNATAAVRAKLAAAARSLVGSRYWLWPCSRVTAEVFIAAGVPVFRPGEPGFRTKLGLILPEDFLTHTILTVVDTVTEDQLK